MIDRAAAVRARSTAGSSARRPRDSPLCGRHRVPELDFRVQSPGSDRLRDEFGVPSHRRADRSECGFVAIHRCDAGAREVLEDDAPRDAVDHRVVDDQQQPSGTGPQGGTEQR